MKWLSLVLFQLDFHVENLWNQSKLVFIEHQLYLSSERKLWWDSIMKTCTDQKKKERKKHTERKNVDRKSSEMPMKMSQNKSIRWRTKTQSLCSFVHCVCVHKWTVYMWKESANRVIIVHERNSTSSNCGESWRIFFVFFLPSPLFPNMYVFI